MTNFILTTHRVSFFSLYVFIFVNEVSGYLLKLYIFILKPNSENYVTFFKNYVTLFENLFSIFEVYNLIKNESVIKPLFTH